MNYSDFIPWIISMLLLIFSALTYFRNGRKENKNEIKEDTLLISSIKESLLKANMKLDQVCATTNETRSDIKCLNKDISEMDRRVTIIERDLKSAFKAIDELKERTGI